jgi:ribosomal protein S18 acetylase RimI-like enzyme
MNTNSYTFRPATDDDAAAMQQLLHAIAAEQPHAYAPTLADVQRELQDPWLNLPADTRLALAPDGSLAARAQVLANPEPGDTIKAFMECDLHPAHNAAGLQTTLLDWLEARGVERLRALGAANSGRPLKLNMACLGVERERMAELERRGFQPVRYYQRMRRDLREPIPDRPLPDGLALRGYCPELDERIRLAHNEAFRDHWQSDPVTAEDWHLFVVSYSTFRPDLSFAVLDGDEVAAYSINRFDPAQAERTGYRAGWIGSLGTRRPWRQRGLASALIAQSMRAFQAAGLDYAGLGVDADNPSGAVGLYESLGFAAYLKNVLYQKALDD